MTDPHYTYEDRTIDFRPDPHCGLVAYYKTDDGEITHPVIGWLIQAETRISRHTIEVDDENDFNDRPRSVTAAILMDGQAISVTDRYSAPDGFVGVDVPPKRQP